MFSKKNNIGVWGWWGNNNLGDNWILSVMKEIFGYNLIPVSDSIKDFSGFDFMLCGGGGLFAEKVKSPWNTKICIPHGVFCIGTEHGANKKEIANLIDSSKFFYVRDKMTANKFGIEDMNLVSGDATFYNPISFLKENKNKKDILFIWRYDFEKLYNYLPIWKQYIGTASTKKFWIQGLSSIGNLRYVSFKTSKDNPLLLFKNAKMVVSQRFHGIVAAIQLGIPCIALDICPKNKAIMDECGLSDYCVKIGEYSKIEELYTRCMDERENIKEKMFNYTKEKKRLVNLAADNAKYQIEKSINIEIKHNKKDKITKVIHFGSYYQFDNDVVYLMAQDLKNCCDATLIDVHLYDKQKELYVREDFSYHKSSTFSIKYIHHNIVKREVEKINPNFIIVNAGGLSLEEKTFEYLKKKHIKTVGISLSDPDVYPYNGRYYAKNFDYFYTNSLFSLQKQYEEDVNIDLLPFATSVKLYKPLNDIKKKYDIIIIGHYRKDREKIINELNKHFKVGLYGSGWKKLSKGIVHGQKHCEALNSGKIYLSFSQTSAGYLNVKVGLFEAAACKMVLITQRFDEILNYFEDETEIILYDNLNDLIVKIKKILNNQQQLVTLSNNSYKRFIENHTWEKRWKRVLKKIKENR